MEGDLSLCVHREPDFFALNRLEGEPWHVGVVEDRGGRPIACVGLGYRDVHLQDVPTRVAYVGDLKVDPAHRTRGVALMLAGWCVETAIAEMGEDVIAYCSVLQGNTAVEGMFAALQHNPNLDLELTQLTTIRSHSIPLLWKRRLADGSARVTTGTPDDIDEMAEFWQKVAPERQLSPVRDAESLARWIERAPGLDIDSYYVARGANGRIAGFFGVWDQRAFKQMRVVSYSRQLKAFRVVFNGAAPLLRVPRLPAADSELRYRSVVDICVPGSDVDVMRALLLHAYADLRVSGCSAFTIGLDLRDPLSAALRGLLAQPTDVEAWLFRLKRAKPFPLLDNRPAHFEIAMV
jgi:GNAT superfamily N-acetyltransferase